MAKGKRGTNKLKWHGKKWYLNLAIPRSVQAKRLILSKKGNPLDKIVEALAGDYDVAKVMAAQRIADCVTIFARIEAGEITTPDQAEKALAPSDYDIANEPGFEQAMRRYLASPELRRAEFERRGRARFERFVKWMEWYGASGDDPATLPAALPAPSGGETISEALEGWIKDLTSNKARRPDTLKGHRVRVQAFIDKHGDLPLTEVTRSMAYDFLSGLGKANRTRNNYAMTMSGIFKCAKLRGRFTGENPFEDMKVDDTGASYEPFTIPELQKLFDALPRDTNPKKHSPATALPWVALISAYSGACLEEICKLDLADIREEEANGGTVTIFDIHNGINKDELKNDEARPRYLPMHSALVRAGLREYIANLRQHGQTRLFPGLKRRASKGNKWSPEVGSRFGKTLRRLGLKRSGLCFHSFRHTVNKWLEEHARVPEVDRARVLGHVHPTMTARYGKGKAGFRSPGPGLKIAAGVVEQIKYAGLRV
jgi:integrase